MIPTPTLPPLIAPSRAISVSSRRRLGSAACACIGTASTTAATNETRSGLSERARADGRIELLQWAGEGHEHRMLNSDMLDDAVPFDVREWPSLPVGKVNPVLTPSEGAFTGR